MPVKKSAAKSKRVKKTDAPAATNYKNDGREKIFALDIGTRSVIGIVAENKADGHLAVIATNETSAKIAL